MSEENGFHEAGMAILWLALVLAGIASVATLVLIYATGDGIGIPWLFVLIAVVFMGLLLLAILLLVIGAMIGPKKSE